jgi:hypothetical protein
MMLLICPVVGLPALDPAAAIPAAMRMLLWRDAARAT